MVNSALSNLDTGAALAAGDLIYIVQGGNSRKRALTTLGAGLLNDTGYTGALSTIGVTALGRSLLDDTGQTTMQSTLGLGTAARENIGTSGANVPRLDGTNIWSNKQTLASAQPLFDFDETDGTSTHRISRLTRNGNIFQLHTADSNGIFVSADWRAVVGASGVTSHSWRINNVEKLLLNSSGLTIADGIADTGVHLAAYFAGGVNADTGTFFRGDGTWAAPVVAGNDWTYATPQATTSGTAFDFTGIPTETSEIEITVEGVGLSGTDHVLIQIGDAGGFETTGYSSGSSYNAAGVSSAAGFVMLISNASATISGMMQLSRGDSTGIDWSSIHGAEHSTVSSISGGGLKTLSAELTQVRITRTGTNTFDAGEVRLKYR